MEKVEKTSEIKPKNVIIRVLCRLVLLLLTAFLIMFFIEWRLLGNNFESAIQFVFVVATPIFFYNALLLFLIELTISSFFKSAWTGPGITFIIAIIISYVSWSKYLFRGQPLLPEDFMLTDQAGTLTQFVDSGSLVRTILACLIVVGLIILLNILSRKAFGPSKSEKGGIFTKNLRYLRFIAILIGVFGFIAGTDFIRNRSGDRDYNVSWLNATFVAWNQQLNYEQNGFILGFMYNWEKLEIEKTEGYSEEKIAEIKEKYAPEEDSKEMTLEDSDVNIITILNESFFDPSILADYYPYSRNKDLTENSMGVPVTDEVIPTIRGLISQDKNSNRVAMGQMYSTDYGGGTANIEFEVDTTMTNFWTHTVPYVDILPHIDSIPSVASIAKEAGYDTVAIHPFNGGMYKRDTALKREGFDEFLTWSEVEYNEIDDNRNYINDRSSYNEVLKALKGHDKKAYISLITMQNHAGYGGKDYSTRSYLLDDAPKAGEDTSPFSEDEKDMVEIYLETLHNSDYYLSEFLAELEKLDEKTVILFYGDHAPGIYGRVNGASDKATRDLARTTPYFIWANFDMPNSTTYETQFDAETAKKMEPERINIEGTTLPTTTPNCLSVTLFSILNIRKSDFMNLAEAACLDTPILTQTYFGNATPEKSEVLREYELYIYDILGGERYWYR